MTSAGPGSDVGFEALLDDVRARAVSPCVGLFGPASITWEVAREVALLLGGPRALLLQIAHPAVATAVAHHSDVRRDPLGRGRRTFEAVYAVMFGDVDAVMATARRVHERHLPVTGTVAETPPSPWSATPYRAIDPELLVWVHATLIDTAILVFDQLIRPLREGERERYYEEGKLSAEVFGIPRGSLPSTYRSFCDYFATMVEGPILQVGVAALEQWSAISRQRPSDQVRGTLVVDGSRLTNRILDGKPLRRLSGGIGRLLAGGMLPRRLLDAFGIPFGRRDHIYYRGLMALLRRTFVRLPARLRFHPTYHQALARLADGAPDRDAPTRAAEAHGWLPR